MTEKPNHSDYVGVLDPPFSRQDYTWKTTYEVPLEPETFENDPMFLIETADGKYIYDELMDALRDMIALDCPVQVYRWDKKSKRHVYYIRFKADGVKE